MRAWLPVLLVLVPLGCGSSSDSAAPPVASQDASSSDSSQDQETSTPLDGSQPEADASTPETSLDASGDGAVQSDVPEEPASDAASGPPDSVLPFAYERPDVGVALSQAELDTATDELIAILGDTRYFEVVDERVHGWPQTDPGGKYWYGTWWSGVTVTKAGGKVTYLHSADGADNNGLRTAPLLEGACYAYLLWNQGAHAHLMRRIVRGYSSWALAMVRHAGDSAPTMLTRASYPVPVQSLEGGRDLFIDYGLNRPGVDNGACQYVHLPDNPTWGDIWAKNKRSKDDIGHMVRSIGQIAACEPRVAGDDLADLLAMREIYASWSRTVEDAAWSIATWDKNLEYWIPPIQETLAHYTTLGNVECPAVLSLRLLGRDNPGSLSCGSGISDTEKLTSSQLNGSAKQILRTSHEAAVNMALFKSANDVALALLQGLSERVESDLTALLGSNPPANVNNKDVASLLLHASNAGVPLTSKEVRFLHQRIHDAYLTYRAPSAASTYRVFDPATPDGTYPYEPGGDGLAYVDLGAVLGTCASHYRNPAGRPVFNCDKLVAWHYGQ
jgi:hypothetical protein